MKGKVIIMAVSALLILSKYTNAREALSTANPNQKKNSRLKFSGYVKDLVTVSIPAWEDDWYFDNLIHNRLNVKWLASKTITFSLEARNRIFFGNSVQFNPTFKDQVTQSLGTWQLDWVVGENNSYFFYSNIDRANFSWRKNRFSAIIGKQRINWGKSYVWNPNDVFNAYSFFDFDYEERRGTDAILLKYVTTPSTSLEIASNISGSPDGTMMAVKYNFNTWEYDFQVLSGKYQTDYFVGLGWEGQIKSAGFKGEVSYFQPYKNDDQDSKIMAAVSFDYTFPNTLAFQLEGIFNSNPDLDNAQNSLLEPVDAKNLTFNQWSVFGSVAYDITPLIILNVNGIYYIDDESYFINPGLTFSLNKNTEFLVSSQIFDGTTSSIFGSLGNYVFTRLKWSF